MGMRVSLADLESIIETWGDLYGFPRGMGPEDVLLAYGKKVDAPIVSSTTGVFTAVSQAMLFAGISNQHNFWSAAPKKRHDRSAFRYVTARGKTSGGGLADAVATPDTVKPTLARPTVTMKLEAVHFDMGAIMQDLGDVGGDDALTWGAFQDYMAQEFQLVLENDITEDNGTLASNNFESLDRVTGSNTEIANIDDGNGAAYQANDLDIYGQDRDAGATAFDAFVSRGAAVSVAEVDRDFTGAPLINALFQNVAPFWDSWDNKLFFSPYDVMEALNEIEGAASRYVTQTFVRTGVNGVQTIPGREGGFAVNSYRGIPWLNSPSLQSDTIGRVYLVDLDYLWVDLLRPPTVLDSGRDTNYVLMQKYSREAANYVEGELYAPRFPVHAKLRGLK